MSARGKRKYLALQSELLYPFQNKNTLKPHIHILYQFNKYCFVNKQMIIYYNTR